MTIDIDWEIAQDAELVDAARGGDDAAFAALYTRHRALALRVAGRTVGRDDVEDVASEAFMAVFDQIRRGRGPTDNVRAYLAASVRHAAIRRSKQQRRTDLVDDLERLDRPTENGRAENLVAERELLASAVAQLTDYQREILWAVEVDGYRPQELAEERGLDSNAVSAVAYRARRALRAAYPRE